MADARETRIGRRASGGNGGVCVVVLNEMKSGWEGDALITSAPKLIMKWIATAYFSNFLLGIQRQQIGTGLHCNRDDDDDRQLSICRNNFRPPRQAINRGFSGPPLQAARSA